VLQKAVGDHIVGFVAGQGDEAVVWERRLWRFVSQATENQLDGDALQRVYLKVIGEPLALLYEPPSGHRVILPVLRHCLPQAFFRHCDPTGSLSLANDNANGVRDVPGGGAHRRPALRDLVYAALGTIIPVP